MRKTKKKNRFAYHSIYATNDLLCLAPLQLAPLLSCSLRFLPISLSFSVCLPILLGLYGFFPLLMKSPAFNWFLSILRFLWFFIRLLLNVTGWFFIYFESTSTENNSHIHIVIVRISSTQTLTHTQAQKHDYINCYLMEIESTPFRSIRWVLLLCLFSKLYVLLFVRT